MLVFLARHASPDLTRSDLIYHLPPGPPLTAQGQAEAQALGLFFQSAGVTKVYSSPLERCAQTARIITQVVSIPSEILPGLTELQPGEDKASLHARLWPLFEQAARESQNQPVALLTHGGAVTFLLGALGMDEATLNLRLTFDHRNPIPPAGSWSVSRDGEGQPWELRLAFTPPAIL